MSETKSISPLMYSAMKQIADASLLNISINANDTRSSDGLLICGVCGEYKQDYLIYDGYEPLKRARQCKCCRTALKKEAELKEEQDHEKRVQNFKAASGLKGRNVDADFTHWKMSQYNEKNYKICQRYAQKFRELFENNQGLLIWGGVGTGKSFAAACIANAIMEQEMSVYMTSSINLSLEEPKVLTSKLLIVDDFGAERRTEYAAEKVFNALNERYNARKPMIITTNLSPSDFKTETDIRYLRMYDRLQEVCYPVQFTGVSYRAGAAIDLKKRMKALLEED